MKRATDRNNKSLDTFVGTRFLISSLLSLSNLLPNLKLFLGKFLDIEYIQKKVR